MLIRLRPIATCLALAAVLGGGLVAPALHEAMHGLEHAQQVKAAAAQTDHIHTDGVGFTVSLDGAGLHAPCLLCAAPHAAPLVLRAPASVLAQSIRAMARPIAPATAGFAPLSIRGPPAVAS